MTTTFELNPVYETELNANFIIGGGTFTTNGQQYILQHFLPITNLTELESWSVDISNTDATNFFTYDIRWSFDTITWTPWIALTSVFAGFPSPNLAPKVWLQFRINFTSDNTKDSVINEFMFTGTRKVDSIFEPAILQPGVPVMFTNADTYKVFSISDFQAFVAQSIPLTGVDIKFRYTQTQGRSWSEWYNLTADILKSIKFDPIRFCNFQFGFLNNNSFALSIYDLELIGDFQNISGNYKKSNRLGLKSQCNPITQPVVGACDPNCPDGYLDQFGNVAGTCIDCCSTCSDSVSPWSLNPECGDGCTTSDLFRINDRSSYGQLPQLKEYLDNALGVRTGWKVQYAMTDPDRKGSDPILHEHQLFNVLAVKNLNIIVPDNQFPTQNISFSGMDLDLIQSFEVHILKNDFKNVFGVEFRPGKEDYLYLCDFNQMWEVDQIVPTRTAFNVQTYHRVLLKKYNKRSNRQHINSTDLQWNEALTKHNTLDDLFKVEVDAELKQASKDVNINVDQPSQQYTHTTMINFRALVNPVVTYEKDLIVNATLTLSETQFGFPLTSKNKKLVTYSYKDQHLKKADNRALSFWFKMEDYDPTWEFNLFNNYDTTTSTGYKLRLFNGNLEFQINTQVFQLPMTLMTKDIWYCVYVGLNQQTGKLEIALYRRQGENGNQLVDSMLVGVHRNIWEPTPESFDNDAEMYIGGCDLHTNNAGGNAKRWQMTNIRVYNQVIAKAKRNIMLNEKTVKDSQLLLLCDNSEEKLILPNYGNL